MKYFIVSDIHGFYIELREALKTAGFDKKNKDHTLVVLGDLFDRGPDALALYKYLISIPKKRCILVRGNHELLYKELLTKDFPEKHDFSNRTVDTFCQLAWPEYKYDFDCTQEYFEYNSISMIYSVYRGDEDDTEAKQDWKKVLKVVKEHPITKLILDDKRWINYFELGNYIMVHSWIPVGCFDGLPAYYIENRHFEYRDDWRNATQTEWDDATWGCPWKMVKKGLNKTGKIIVCGHWSTPDFFKHLKNIKKPIGEGPIYYSKEAIALDGGVYYNNYYGVYIHPQNVLVIDNGICYDKHNKELKEPKPVPYIFTTTLKK